MKNLSKSELKEISGGSEFSEKVFYYLGVFASALSQAGASKQERSNYYW